MEFEMLKPVLTQNVASWILAMFQGFMRCDQSPLRF